MSREIRRVPANWQHPEHDHCPHWGGRDAHKNSISVYQRGKCFHPLYDEDFDTALREWMRNYELWKRDEHDGFEYHEIYGSPPNPEYYRPAWTPGQATHYQLYETVSEGTPMSPVFETLDELAEWLIENGSSEKAARNFIKIGSVPSSMYSPQTGWVDDIEIAGLDR